MYPSSLILSLFPGIDLLGHGFERAGFCVVRGPDKLFGGDIRTFHAPAGRFDGVIGGPPCQEFSKINRNRKPEKGMEMIEEFIRVVEEAEPAWFLMENVPEVPNVSARGYTVQRFALNSREVGSQQRRNRHFQFGSKAGLIITPKRASATEDSRSSGTNKSATAIQESADSRTPATRTVLASEGKTKDRRAWADVCELQGLSRDFDLPGWSLEAKYRAVGNGVHVQVAYTIAQAIRDAKADPNARLCKCGCGRVLEGRGDQKTATASCRSRYRYQKRAEPGV